MVFKRGFHGFIPSILSICQDTESTIPYAKMGYETLSGGELAKACALTGDLAAWEEFVHRFQPLIARVAANTAYKWGESSTELMDDIVQDTYLRLCADNCRLLRNFRERHPDAIFGYLKAVAASVAHDHMKALHASKRGGKSNDISLTEAIEPVSSHDEATRAILLDEIHKVLLANGVSERDRMVFWLYYRDGLTAQAIASLKSLGLTTKGVESLIFRLVRVVRGQLVKTKDHTTDRESPGNEGICTA